MHNRSPSGAQKVQSYFGKFTSCVTFGAHKLIRYRSEPFLESCKRYIAGCVDLKKISQLSIRSGAHKLFRRFLEFSKFSTEISQKLWHRLSVEMRTM